MIIHKIDKSVDLYYGKLSGACTFLSDKDFLRVGQSYIVNLDKIDEMRRAEILMLDGDVVPISRKYRDEVMRAYMKYREDESRGR